MTWNPSFIDGPLTIYTYGPPDADGIMPVTGTVAGYHLNAAPSLNSAALAPYLQAPVTPTRVWAGDTPVWSTIFLKFASEAQARSVLPDVWIDPA